MAAWKMVWGWIASGTETRCSFSWPGSGTYHGFPVNPKYMGIQVVQARPYPVTVGGIRRLDDASLHVEAVALTLRTFGIYYSVTVKNFGLNSLVELVGVRQ